jgi:alcohol dehydrogenase (NADP+)
MVLVGLPDQPYEFHPGAIIFKRKQLAGSLIGGIKETQEMLDFCAEKNITSDVEIIPMQKIEEAYSRTIKADVRYRFVIDLSSL